MPQLPNLDALFHPANRLPVLSTAALTLALLLCRTTRRNRMPIKVLPSPRTSLLPGLFPTEIGQLPYPPDVLPGGRWVESPFGAIRVYEWGPEAGRKVLLVHGISTPCIALGGVAEGLVGRGCRVMLIDLFGRGYSDSPADLPHDSRLYTSEILFAITSSTLSWKTFSLIGYSLGGGISASFAAYFPQMVESLVLLAPGGLIRPNRISWISKFLYSTDWIPGWVVAYLVERRMRGFQVPDPSKPRVPEEDSGGDKATPECAVAAETVMDPTPRPLSRKYPDLSLKEAIVFQLSHHAGYLPAFISSARFAPISEQHEDWRRLARNAANFQTGKVLILAGEADDVIVPEELKQDAEEAMGRERIEWQLLLGKGHEFPIVAGEDVAERIGRFWGLKTVDLGG